MNYYKITNKAENHNGMRYRDGLNEDVLPFVPSGSCTSGGIYFSREDILAFLGYGPWIRRVELPEGEEVYEDPEPEPKKWKSHRVVLGERRGVYASVIRELIEEGANPRVCDSRALRWAAENGHREIVEMLKKQIN